MPDLRLTALTAAHLPLIEPWFDDPETSRRLGGRHWPRTMLNASCADPGRYVYVACDGAEPAAVIDLDHALTGIVSVSLVVAPGRRGEGIARACCTAAAALEHMAGVRVEAHIAHDNVASLALAQRLGMTAGSSGGDGFIAHHLAVPSR